jgi:hypothetical protein
MLLIMPPCCHYWFSPPITLPPLTPRHAIAMLSMLRRCHASAAAAFDTPRFC